MKGQETQQVQRFLLQSLFESRPGTLPAEWLRDGLNTITHQDYSLKDVAAQLHHLESEGMVKSTFDRLDHSSKRYEITAEGTKYLQEVGLA